MRILLRAFIPAMLLLLAANAAIAQQPPRNSYIATRVNSVADLVQQVRTNHDVMDRYRRHFAMNDAEVLDYLSSLRVSKLEKDGVYNVYGVPHTTGDFHAHLRLLKRGEPVLIEADGTPALMLVCGNPLLLGPKKPAIPNPVLTPTGTPEGERPTEIDANPVPSPGQPTPEAPGVDNVPTPDYPRHRDSSLPLLLGLAGGIGFFIHTRREPRSCPPVPEPMTMLVMGGGVAAMAARRRKKKATV